MTTISRRTVLAGIGATTAAGLIGCGSSSTGAALVPPDATGDPPVPPPDAPLVIEAPACSAVSTKAPGQLLAEIESIVVLCMENRSFDHYLGSLRLLEGRLDIDGLVGGESNPRKNGAPVVSHLLEDFTPADPPHNWDPAHEQWNNGANDGFVRAHAGANEADVMGYHTRAQLPVTYALADAGVVCNRWFSGCLGPTWPNRYYLHGGTARGRKGNLPALGFPNLFTLLGDRGVDATNYYSDVAWATGAYGKLSGLATIERFFEDAEGGNLPPFSIVDPSFFGGGANDDHPDHDVRLGQAFIASVTTAIARSKQWAKTLFVITYDENGGFYDHVSPPTAHDDEPEFRQLGFRVPTLVLGGAVRRGCAVDAILEHSSIAATAALRWGLGTMTTRAAAARDLSVCIDEARLADPLPPPAIPQVEISLAQLARRQELARARPISHAELSEAIDRIRPPRALDRRADADAVARRTLAWGERLGAVRLVD
jgi:phospholipase C